MSLEGVSNSNLVYMIYVRLQSLNLYIQGVLNVESKYIKKY